MGVIIDLESPFKELWKKGYLVVSKGLRKNVVLFNSDSDRTTISYARYLMCVKIGDFLPASVEVDHIDADKTNDTLENLQVLSVEDHKIKTAKEAAAKSMGVQEVACAYCHTLFNRRVRTIRNGRKIFCSRSCNAKYHAKIGVNKVGSEITEDQKAEIRRLNLEGLSGYKISKLLSISRNTVYKYIK